MCMTLHVLFCCVDKEAIKRAFAGHYSLDPRRLQLFRVHSLHQDILPLPLTVHYPQGRWGCSSGPPIVSRPVSWGHGGSQTGRHSAASSQIPDQVNQKSLALQEPWWRRLLTKHSVVPERRPFVGTKRCYFAVTKESVLNEQMFLLRMCSLAIHTTGGVILSLSNTKPACAGTVACKGREDAYKEGSIRLLRSPAPCVVLLLYHSLKRFIFHRLPQAIKTRDKTIDFNMAALSGEHRRVDIWRLIVPTVVLITCLIHALI